MLASSKNIKSGQKESKVVFFLHTKSISISFLEYDMSQFLFCIFGFNLQLL